MLVNTDYNKESVFRLQTGENSLVQKKWVKVGLVVAALIFAGGALYGGLGLFAPHSTIAQFLAHNVGTLSSGWNVTLFAGGLTGVTLSVTGFIVGAIAKEQEFIETVGASAVPCPPRTIDECKEEVQEISNKLDDENYSVEDAERDLDELESIGKQVASESKIERNNQHTEGSSVKEGPRDNSLKNFLTDITILKLRILEKFPDLKRDGCAGGGQLGLEWGG